MDRVDIAVNDALPKLSWLFVWDHAGQHGSAECGPDVVIHDNAIWEGVHCSPGDPSRTDELTVNLASGVFIRDGVPHVFAPSHNLDRIFSLQLHGMSFFSNSLPFLLSRSRTRLRDDYFFYPWDFEMLDGFDRTLPLEGGHSLRFYCNCILRVDEQIAVKTYTSPSSFETYEEYLTIITEAIGQVLAMANRPPNKMYRPLSTVSRGYDSTAVNVLLQKWGVKDALSVLDGRGLGADSEDISELRDFLGLTVHAVRRDAYLQDGLVAEKIFYLYGLAENIPFYPLREHMAGRLLFTGHGGDSMWGRENVDLHGRSSTSSTVATQSTMQELRLHVGFVNCSPATIAYQHQNKLVSIANSAALRPWSVGGSYDRPVPRRIAEDFGIPRDWFGIQKSAVTVSAGLDAKDNRISPEFAELLAEHIAGLGALKFGLARLMINPLASAIQAGGEYFKSRAAVPVVAATGKPSQKARISKLLKNIPFRRKFLRPIGPLTFAAQVACRLATEQYDATRADHAQQRQT